MYSIQLVVAEVEILQIRQMGDGSKTTQPIEADVERFDRSGESAEII